MALWSLTLTLSSWNEWCGAAMATAAVLFTLQITQVPGNNAVQIRKTWMVSNDEWKQHKGASHQTWLLYNYIMYLKKKTNRDIMLLPLVAEERSFYFTYFYCAVGTYIEHISFNYVASVSWTHPLQQSLIIKWWAFLYVWSLHLLYHSEYYTERLKSIFKWRELKYA